MYCSQCGAELNSGGKFCSKCGAVADTDRSSTEAAGKPPDAVPHFSPKTKKSMSNGKAILIALTVALAPFVLLALFLGSDSSKDTSRSTTASATDDASASFIKLLGAPDLIETSEYDNPRPPIVAKTLIYNKHDVKLTFIADAPLNTPPPYSAWALVDASDADTGESLPVDEFKRRVGLR